MRKCSIKNCNLKHKAKNYCVLHYVRFSKHGDPEIVLPQVKKKIPLEVRFWKYVLKGKSINSCWEWTGSKIKFGYGMLRVDKTGLLAHRIAYELLVGKIGKDLFVCHSCDNPECCNPKHLWLGTNKDNTDDRDIKGRCKANDGMNNGRAKITNEQVLMIRKNINAGKSLNCIAKEFSISKTSVSKIKRGVSWVKINAMD